MKWLILLAGVVAVCLFAAVALGFIGGGMGGPGSTLSHEPLPDDRLSDEVLDEVQFDVTARGYRMSQVDGVVDRLRRELRERDDEIAVLRAELDVTSPPAAPPSAAAPAQSSAPRDDRVTDRADTGGPEA